MMGKPREVVEEIVNGSEPESERLLAALCAMGKAVTRAVGMVWEYGPG